MPKIFYFKNKDDASATITPLIIGLIIALPCLFIGGWFGNQFLNPSATIIPQNANMNITISYANDFSMTKYLKGYDRLTNENGDYSAQVGIISDTMFESFQIQKDFNLSEVELSFQTNGYYETNISIWNATTYSSTLIPDTMIYNETDDYQQYMTDLSVELKLSNTEGNTFFIAMNYSNSGMDTFNIIGTFESDGLSYTNQSSGFHPNFTPTAFHFFYTIYGNYLDNSNWLVKWQDNSPLFLYLKLGFNMSGSNDSTLYTENDLTYGMVNNSFSTEIETLPNALDQSRNYTTKIETSENISIGHMMEFMCISPIKNVGLRGALAVDWGFLFMMLGVSEPSVSGIFFSSPLTNGSVVLETNKNHTINITGMELYRNLGYEFPIPYIDIHTYMTIDNIAYDFVIQTIDTELMFN